MDPSITLHKLTRDLDLIQNKTRNANNTNFDNAAIQWFIVTYISQLISKVYQPITWERQTYVSLYNHLCLPFKPHRVPSIVIFYMATVLYRLPKKLQFQTENTLRHLTTIILDAGSDRIVDASHLSTAKCSTLELARHAL